jgi:hypothetical protein
MSVAVIGSQEQLLKDILMSSFQRSSSSSGKGEIGSGTRARPDDVKQLKLLLQKKGNESPDNVTLKAERYKVSKPTDKFHQNSVEELKSILSIGVINTTADKTMTQSTSSKISPPASKSKSNRQSKGDSGQVLKEKVEKRNSRTEAKSVKKASPEHSPEITKYAASKTLSSPDPTAIPIPDFDESFYQRNADSINENFYLPPAANGNNVPTSICDASANTSVRSNSSETLKKILKLGK